jgi:hypothetical protein
LFGERAAQVALSGLVDARAETAVAGELAPGGEAVDVADLGGDRVGEHPADPGDRGQQRHVAVIGAGSPQLAPPLVDLAVELVDHRHRLRDVPAPGIGHVEAPQQLAAADAEQVGDRARRSPGHQRRVDALLEPRPLADQVKAPAGALALGADRGVGKPDRRHQLEPRELRQDPGVDAVGLGGQRRQAPDLLGVGDLHLPAMALEGVVDEAGAGHRLDRGADRLPIAEHALGEPAKAVGVGRRGADVELPAVGGERVVVEPATAQVESNVQHGCGPPWWISVTGVSLPPGGPPSWHLFV